MHLGDHHDQLLAACRAAQDMPALLAHGLPLVRALTGARSVAVVRRHDGSCDATAAAGDDLDLEQLDLSGVGRDAPTDVPVPTTWTSGGIGSAVAQELPGDGCYVLVAWGDEPPADVRGATRALATLDGAAARLVAEAELADLVARVDNAQQLADMGDYDWHIATDRNRWSDQLYRIYGHEPQAFNASYERFLSFIHPEDRERIQAIHQSAYASGEPYQMIERIIRADGQVRYLSSNGQVIQDETGAPVRMRGTCIDITDRVLAEQEREHSAARFRALVETCPDAILVHDRSGTVIQANGHATQLLGADPVGRSVREVLPWPMPATMLGVSAVGLAGQQLQLDVTASALDGADESGLVACFLHDAAPRLANETMLVAVNESQVRRRQALELNDNVVQGLTAAVLALQIDDEEGATAYLEGTLNAARSIMNEWLEPLQGKDLAPGDLVRSDSSDLSPAAVTSERTAPSGDRPRILVVDDNTDVRRLLRLKLETSGESEVVGEAEDGEEAVRLARELQPSVVLLDLAMPRMDGLQALPLILEDVPDVRVIVLSGFDQQTMAEKAFAAGAHAYLEKGLRMELDETIASVLAGRTA